MVSIFGTEYSLGYRCRSCCRNGNWQHWLLSYGKKVFFRWFRSWLAYVLICLVVVIYNYKAIPNAIVGIIQSAFGIKAAAGGALGTMLIAMQKGVARGIFSNEAGLGSAPIAAAAAQTKEPVRQGLVTMTGVCRYSLHMYTDWSDNYDIRCL